MQEEEEEEEETAVVVFGCAGAGRGADGER
jgi:hypothetical protein